MCCKYIENPKCAHDYFTRILCYFCYNFHLFFYSFFVQLFYLYSWIQTKKKVSSSSHTHSIKPYSIPIFGGNLRYGPIKNAVLIFCFASTSISFSCSHISCVRVRFLPLELFLLCCCCLLVQSIYLIHQVYIYISFAFLSIN